MSSLANRRSILGAVLLLAVGMSGYFLFSKDASKHELISSPTEVRPWAKREYSSMVDPLPSSTSPLDPIHLSPITIKSSRTVHSDSSIIVTEYETDEKRSAFPYRPSYEIIKFNARDGFRHADGKGEMKWMTKSLWSVDPYRKTENFFVFHADHTLITGGEEVPIIDACKANRKRWYGTKNDSTAWIGLLLDGFSDVQWCPQTVFDASTQVNLNENGGGRSQLWLGNNANIHFAMPLWHSTPLLGVMDFAHGPVETFHGSFREGVTLGDHRFRFTLLLIQDGKVEYMNNTRRGVEFMTRRKTLNTACACLFQVEPSVMSNAVTVEAVDRDGKVVTSSMVKRQEFCDLIQFNAPRTQIASIRVKLRPHWKRLLMTVDQMPGLPKVNARVGNLFDVVVPEIRVKDEGELIDFITEATQLKCNFKSGTSLAALMPGKGRGSFPKVLYNTTPRQAVDLYLASGQAHSVEVDTSAKIITFRNDGNPPKMWVQARDWLKHHWP